MTDPLGGSIDPDLDDLDTTRDDLLASLLLEAPPFVVFGLSPEREAAQCHLAARLIRAGHTILDVTAYRYAFSLGLASGDDTATAYLHYFEAPSGALVSVTTRHTPGHDDLGGLIRPAQP